MNLRVGVSLLFAYLFVAEAMAAVPRTDITRSQQANEIELGDLCYGFSVQTRSWPCQPAVIAQEHEASTKLQLYISPNVKMLRQAEELSSGDPSGNALDELMAIHESSELSSQVLIGYQQPTWGVALIPARVVSYFSVANPALPVMEILASKEEELKTTVGSYVGHDLYLGTHVRFIHRQFVYANFTAAEALPDNRNELLRTKDQNVVMFEPGAVYALEDEPWSPQLSFAMADLGFADKKYAPFAMNPRSIWGLSVRPPTGAFKSEQVTSLIMQDTDAGLRVLLNIGTEIEWKKWRLGFSFSNEELKLGSSFDWSGWLIALNWSDSQRQNILGETTSLRRFSLVTGYEF